MKNSRKLACDKVVLSKHCITIYISLTRRTIRKTNNIRECIRQVLRIVNEDHKKTIIRKEIDKFIEIPTIKKYQNKEQHGILRNNSLNCY